MAEYPSLLLSNKDEQNKTPLWRAFERFKSTLDEGDISCFNQTTLTEVLCQVRDLDRKHIASSTTRQISSRLEPFFHFLDRYGRALDCLAQVQPKPSAIIWGILRIILEVRFSTSATTAAFLINTEGEVSKVVLSILQKISFYG
jgi:hypothetical protein